MIPLKKNFTYLILDKSGQVNSKVRTKESGFYHLDTRMLDQYEWDFSDYELLHSEFEGSRSFTQHFSQFKQHKQTLLVIRTLKVVDGGFIDSLQIRNDDSAVHQFTPKLNLSSDYLDMFEVRGHRNAAFTRTNIQQSSTDEYFSSVYVAEDEVTASCELTFEGFLNTREITLEPRTSHIITVQGRFSNDFSQGSSELNVPDNWLSSDKISDPYHIYKQAELDLHDLLLSTQDGLTIAAGIPWFVTPFGRDSIITSWLLLESYPQLAKGTLRYLAAHQGKKVDQFRDEQPGKILHEQRYSELSRIGQLPFYTYYGTADATPLFLMLLADYVKFTKDTAIIDELRNHWESALDWLCNYEDERGLIIFLGNEEGLTVQSWKDSHDSLSYSDGRLGEGTLAVAEVQGYAYAAYLGCSEFYETLGEFDKAQIYLAKANRLQNSFESLFWMPEHHNYAIAVDEQSSQLDINSSDTGHLLWSGIVPTDKAEIVVKRLFSEDMWSGWGLRTLSTKEARYNPISYHNGSIWPHDTAIFAAGLLRYDFHTEFNIVRDALIDVARSQHDKRLPELFSGYKRDEVALLPYVEACRPQAWSAAALIYTMSHSDN